MDAVWNTTEGGVENEFGPSYDWKAALAEGLRGRGETKEWG